MALPTVYNTGTASVTAGETAVTGQGTTWLTSGLKEGDLFAAAGLSVRIVAIISNTSMTIANAWPGTTRAAASYEVRFTPDTSRVLASARAVLDALTNGVLYTFSQLVGAANKLPYFTGAGAFALTDLTVFGRSLIGAANSGAAYAALGTVPNVRLPVVARSGGMISPRQLWAGFAQLNTWTSGNANKSQAGDNLNLLATADDPQIYRSLPSGGVAGSQARYVAFRYKHNSGSFDGTLYYSTSGHGFTGAFRGKWDATVVGEWATVVLDMWEPFAGGTDWLDSIITGIRIDFTTNSGSSIDIAWIGLFEDAPPIGRRSFVGTVSQSAGVPLGEIIERGSNANGEYVRFADGTQTCSINSITIKPSSDTVAGVKSAVWTYPAAFVATPSVTMGINTNRPDLRGKSSPSATVPSVTLYYSEEVSSASNVTANATANGRWF